MLVKLLAVLVQEVQEALPGMINPQLMSCASEHIKPHSCAPEHINTNTSSRCAMQITTMCPALLPNRELDVVATIHNLSRSCPAFWRSDELMRSCQAGEWLGLDRESVAKVSRKLPACHACCHTWVFSRDTICKPTASVVCLTWYASTGWCQQML